MDFKQWATARRASNVNVALHRVITERYRVIGRFGDTEHLPAPLTLGSAFVLYELR